MQYKIARVLLLTGFLIGMVAIPNQTKPIDKAQDIRAGVSLVMANALSEPSYTNNDLIRVKASLQSNTETDSENQSAKSEMSDVPIWKTGYTNKQTTVYDEDGNKVDTLSINTKVKYYKDGKYAITTDGQKIKRKDISKKKTEVAFTCVKATAYCTGSRTADGSGVHPWFTLAGKREWLGKKCNLYTKDSNGSYKLLCSNMEFHDTGYGINGDIPRGETIDIFMSSYSECRNWGRRTVYIEWVN